MPYIKPEHRKMLAVGGQIFTAGELNYMFTWLGLEYLKTNGISYQTINDCIGALEGCKLEFYRRVVVPYEDKKMEENGDVFIETGKHNQKNWEKSNDN